MIEGLAATKVLASEGIPVNMTLWLYGASGYYGSPRRSRYVSPFIGRFDDISEDGLDQVANIVSA